MTDHSLPAAGVDVPTNLSTLKLAELQQLASALGIAGVSKLRKGDLVIAITQTQSAASAPAAPADEPIVAAESPAAETPAAESPNAETPVADAPNADAPNTDVALGTAADAEAAAPRRRGSRRVSSDTLTALPVATITETIEPAASDESGEKATTTEQTGDDEAASEQTNEDDAAASGQAGDDAATSGRGRNRNRNRRGGDRADNGDARAAQSGGQQSGGQQTGGQQTGGQQTAGRESGRADATSRAERADNQRGETQRGDNQRGDNQRADSQRTDNQRGTEPNRGPQNDRADQDADGRNRNRGRGRDRKRGPGGEELEPEISDDDVLIPVAGILDVLDNYAFVRTTGYLPGPSDVYVSLGQVKKYSLRKGDAVVGAIRQPREGENQGRQKYNALVRVDSVNGQTVDEAAARVEFSALTPLYPTHRLRLETEAGIASTRIIDIAAPIGKGQRGLIVSPPRAGKTLVVKAVADAIAKNNPEVHLMVVLVDERPEEVTDVQRSVKGEVIASTFDRPAEDHTTVAELAIERAKRLVELGHDVVVLLDSMTRLGRAYTVTVPTSGRLHSSGVDAAALYPLKRIFAAARNIEDGGSLTILATALIETGSKIDEFIFEEFEGTGNMQLRLSRQLADKRIFPAIDISASGTQREEMLLGADEVRVTGQLRRAIASLDTQQALEMVLSTLHKTSSNVEFLVAVQKALPPVTALHTADVHTRD